MSKTTDNKPSYQSITVMHLLDEIEHIKTLALECEDYKTALNCIMSKAKLLGGGEAMINRERHNSDPVTQLLGNWQ